MDILVKRILQGGGGYLGMASKLLRYLQSQVERTQTKQQSFVKIVYFDALFAHYWYFSKKNTAGRRRIFCYDLKAAKVSPKPSSVAKWGNFEETKSALGK